MYKTITYTFIYSNHQKKLDRQLPDKAEAKSLRALALPKHHWCLPRWQQGPRNLESQAAWPNHQALNRENMEW
jgi:hypothetical protein